MHHASCTGRACLAVIVTRQRRLTLAAVPPGAGPPPAVASQPEGSGVTRVARAARGRARLAAIATAQNKYFPLFRLSDFLASDLRLSGIPRRTATSSHYMAHAPHIITGRLEVSRARSTIDARREDGSHLSELPQIPLICFQVLPSSL